MVMSIGVKEANEQKSLCSLNQCCCLKKTPFTLNNNTIVEGLFDYFAFKIFLL